MHGVAFIRLDARNRRPLRLERTTAGRDDQDLALKHFALIRRHAEQRVADLFDLLDHFAEMELRLKILDLQQQRINKSLRAGIGNARNVVDRLLGIKLRALAADLVENIDEMAFHIEQAELKYREQADRPRTDNDNVSFDRLSHVVFLLVYVICLMWRSV